MQKLKIVNCYAKRFTKKFKALGTGISKGINFKDIIILNKKSGKPYKYYQKKNTFKKFKKNQKCPCLFL